MFGQIICRGIIPEKIETWKYWVKRSSPVIERVRNGETKDRENPRTQRQSQESSRPTYRPCSFVRISKRLKAYWKCEGEEGRSHGSSERTQGAKGMQIPMQSRISALRAMLVRIR